MAKIKALLGTFAQQEAAGADASATRADVATKQALARVQRERIVSLGETIAQQKVLVKHDHDVLDRIVLTKVADNTTDPTPHTRELRAKLKVMDKIVTALAAACLSSIHNSYNTSPSLSHV